MPTAVVQVGSVLGKCLLTEQLGRGSDGLVFRALHQSLNLMVAVKILRPSERERDRRIYQNFKSEAILLAQLNHPHIVRVWDFEDDPTMPYLVMDCVEGPNLAELIEQSGRLRPDRAVQIVAQIADGLWAASRTGIIHRDVKPGNILLDKSGNAKLVDLGQAVSSTDRTGDGAADPLDSGDADRVAGTPAYMAPEQFLDPSTVDFRADIYALGATFYHALTGRMPFTGRSPREVMFKHAREPLVPPNEIVPDLEQAYADVTERMMAKDPADRYASYEELLDDLTLLLHLEQLLEVDADLVNVEIPPR